MSREPIKLDANSMAINARMVRQIFHDVDRRFFGWPEWAQAHPIQRICWANAYQTIEIVQGVPADMLKHEMTIGGIPLKIDDKMPADVIEFYRGTQLVARSSTSQNPRALMLIQLDDRSEFINPRELLERARLWALLEDWKAARCGISPPPLSVRDFC